MFSVYLFTSFIYLISLHSKPKLKVGTEWVNKGSSCSQAANSVAGIARAIYERTFRIVVEKCNETLIDPSMKKVHYIGRNILCRLLSAL